MIRIRRFWGFLPLLLLALVPACNERSGTPAVPGVAKTPKPGSELRPDGPVKPKPTIPPPREIPPAAEPTDRDDALEVFVVAREKGGWAFQHTNGARERDDLH